jgi:hypothetical protein
MGICSMTDREHVSQQLAILKEHRRKLAVLLKQKAIFGVYVPHYMISDIDEARVGIRHCKEALRSWGETVQDHLDDDEPIDQLMLSSASEKAGIGFETMANLLDAPDVRAVVEGFRESFEIACQQIDRLSNYKDLHDLLHELQFNCYNPIIRGCRDFPNNVFFLESLQDYAYQLQKIVTSLSEVVGHEIFTTSEQTWIDQLNRSYEWLNKSIQDLDQESLNRATFQIGRVLYVHPSRINERLKEAARDLPLSSLIRAMTVTKQHPLHTHANSDHQLNQLTQGIMALEQLSQSLVQLIAEHDTWQDIDLELHRIEGDPAQYSQQFEWLWSDLKPQIAFVCENHRDRWTQDLLQASEKLDYMLMTQNAITILATFHSFRRQVGLCFFQADKRLKELCCTLRRVDGPLKSVMSIIA